MSTDAIAAAATRLTLSRMRLHKAFHAHANQAPATWPWGQPAPEWVERLRASPEVQILWEKAKPMLMNKSAVLLVGAAFAGCILLWSRPRRWLLQPAVLAALLPYLLSQLNSRAPPSSAASP